MDVGLQVREGVSNGVTPFIEASKHNIGLLMERERGVPRKVVRVDSLQEDRLRFGGLVQNQFGAYITRHIFNNAGRYGAIVYGVRMLDELLSVAATGQLRDSSVASTLALLNMMASGSDQGQVDQFTPASVVAGAVFRITLGSSTVSFTATLATVANVTAGLAAAIAAEVIAHPTGAFATNSVTAVDNTNSLTLTGADDVDLTYSTSVLSPDVIVNVWAGQEGQKDPGTWGNDLEVKVYPKDHAQGVANAYLWEVYYKGKLVESWTAASWETSVAGINQRSKYIMLEAVVLASRDITDVQVVTLAGGVYAAPTEASFYPVADPITPNGLAIFDGVDVQLIGNTEFHTETMANQGKTYCQSRGNAMYIANLPYLADTSIVEDYALLLQSDVASQVACYNGWVKTTDDNGNFVWVPGLGCVLGAGYVRTPEMSRGHVWIPPAGVDSAFVDVSDISPNPLSQATINLWVQRYSVNVAVQKPGKGFFLYSSRTMSTNALYHSAHIRRMTNWLVDTLNGNTLFSVQKPNTPALRREIVVALKMYFKGIYDQGGLEGSVSFDEACTITCDKTNNPPGQDRKVLNCRIEWIPTECTESVVLELNRNDGILLIKAVEAA